MTIWERLLNIGQDSTSTKSEPTVSAINIPKKKNFLLGTFLDLGLKKLSGEKTISKKLLESFYGWTYINVTTIAEEVSKFQPELFKTVIRGGKIINEPVTISPLLDLLDKFNPITTRSDGFYLTAASLELTGDAFWYLEGGENGGQPTAIYLLQPDKVEVNLSDTGEVMGYSFKTVIDGKTYEREYGYEEVLHIKVPNPSNPYRGMSVVEGIADSLDIDSYATQTTRSFYENGMMANFVLSTDQKLTSDQLKRLRGEMRAAYTGSKNAFKVPIFGGGIDVKQLSQSSKDAEQIKQQMWQRDMIMAAFSNTKASLGIVEDVNRANAESTIDFWRQSVILPKMQRIANAINEFVTPRYGDNLILGVVDPAGDDRDAMIAETIKLKGAGIITRNEARQLVGYEEVEGGDLFPDQANGNVPKSVQNVNYKRMYRQSGIYEQQKEYNEILPKAKTLLTNYKNKNKKPIKKHDRNAIYIEKQLALIDSEEKQFKNTLNQYLEGLTDRVVSKTDILLANKQFENDIINEEEERAAIIALLLPVLTVVALKSANHANELINNKQPFVLRQEQKNIILDQINKFAGSMLDTDKQKIADIIARGLNEGLGPQKVSSQLRETFGQYTKTQADRVARSELLRTANRFSEQAWEESGVVEFKQWSTDANPCPYCEPLDGTIIPIGKTFIKKGTEWFGNAEKPMTVEYETIKRPPLHVNCECVLLPVVSEKKYDNNKKEIKELIEYNKELEKILGVNDE